MEEIFGMLNPALLVATVDDGSERSGCVVGFATQCSIHPLRLLVCLSMANRTYEVARHARSMAVHAVGSDQHELARHFGEATGDEVDKFAGLACHAGATGAPVLEECTAWMEGWIEGRVPLGDHVGYVLAPAEGGSGAHRGVLRLDDAADLHPGHAPDEVRTSAIRTSGSR